MVGVFSIKLINYLSLPHILLDRIKTSETIRDNNENIRLFTTHISLDKNNKETPNEIFQDKLSSRVVNRDNAIKPSFQDSANKTRSKHNF